MSVPLTPKLCGATEEDKKKKGGYTLWHSWCWDYVVSPEETKQYQELSTLAKVTQRRQLQRRRGHQVV